LNVALPSLPFSTVTSIVFVPYFSCHASTVYLPGCTLSILNLPSEPVSACSPVFDTPV
jgi:hypothetical protein